MGIFWAVVLTGFLALAVATIGSRRRRRSRVADLYANQGTIDAARGADQSWSRRQAPFSGFTHG